MDIKTKYAPASLNDVVYPDDATEMIVKSLADGNLNGHVIFYGPRGTAKTTTANLLTHAIGGSTAHIETNFDTLLAMPDLMFHLKQSCHLASLTTQSKCFLLFNEFDNYKGTPYQLWDAMDLLQSKGLMLIITTNDLMAIHPSIRSRCRLIEFPAVTAEAMRPRAQHILSAEGLSLPDSQVLSYLKGQERFGDHRKYIELLDELLLIQKSGLPFKQWPALKPNLTIV